MKKTKTKYTLNNAEWVFGKRDIFRIILFFFVKIPSETCSANPIFDKPKSAANIWSANKSKNKTPISQNMQNGKNSKNNLKDISITVMKMMAHTV